MPAVLLLGLFVSASPWIWGYAEVDHAIATDVVTGSAIAAVALVSRAYPALGALNVLAGLWLVTAPWLVGYGTHGGPVGLSDTLAGILVCGLSVWRLVIEARRAQAPGPGPVGRIRRRPPP
jgi:SPW repeat-containing protein